jgi:hypothetical protein
MLLKIKKIVRKKPYFLVVLSTPLIWWLTLSPFAVFRVWGSYPSALRNSIDNIFSQDRLTYIEQMRWDSFSLDKNDFSSRLFFNKGTLLINDFFDYLSYLAPDFYFHAGDGRNFSPKGVEPIAGFLFFFWLIGVIHLVKQNKFMIIVFPLIVGFLAFIAGQKNLAMLFPVGFTYVFIVSEGIRQFKGKTFSNHIYIFSFTFGIYLLLRSLWLI